MLNEPYRIEEGCLVLNGKPGLGYELENSCCVGRPASIAGLRNSAP